MIDNSNIQVIGYVVIRDPDTNETFLNRRDKNIVPIVIHDDTCEPATETTSPKTLESDCDE